MNYYKLTTLHRWSADEVITWTHYPQANQVKLPNVMEINNIKWLIATTTNPHNITPHLLSADTYDPYPLEDWDIVEADSENDRYEWRQEPTPLQQQQIEQEGHLGFLNNNNYDIDSSEVTITGPVEITEVTERTRKDITVTHEYPYKSRRYYRDYTEEQLVIDLLKDELTPDAIYYRIKETFAALNIRINKRYAKKIIINKQVIGKKLIEIVIQYEPHGLEIGIYATPEDYPIPRVRVTTHLELSAQLNRIIRVLK